MEKLHFPDCLASIMEEDVALGLQKFVQQMGRSAGGGSSDCNIPTPFSTRKAMAKPQVI